MLTLKAENLKADQGKIYFKKWNVKANSILSEGSVIFTYEYQIDAEKKIDRYKSTLNGVIVKDLFSFLPEQLLNSEYILKSK